MDFQAPWWHVWSSQANRFSGLGVCNPQRRVGLLATLGHI
jgi:hypothetical protein